MRDLYAIAKTRDADLRFSFFTGVTRFARTGLFSGVNNLKDITLSPLYSAICGYTEADLDRVFERELEGLDRNEIREWYNGYSWLGEEKVYNPYCILQLLEERKLGPWWYESGTPGFLLNELAKHDDLSIDLEGWIDGLEDLSAFDIGRISIKVLMFQSGYLTVREDRREDGRAGCRLEYPNREVRQVMSRVLLNALAPVAATAAPAGQLHEALLDGDPGRLMELLHAFFAGMPHQWYTNTRLAESEGHYVASVRALFAGAEIDARGEESTNRGRMDLVAVTEAGPYVFEFKIADPANPGAVLSQIHDRGYAERYADGGSPVRLVGLEFDPKKRNVALLQMDPGDGGEVVSIHAP